MKRIMIIFPKDSEAIFNAESSRTFGGATVQMFLIAGEMRKNPELDVYSLICDYDTINFKEEKSFNLVKGYKEKDGFITRLIKFHRAISGIRPDVIIQHGLTNESCLLALYCFLMKKKFVFMFAHDVEVKKRFQSSGRKCYIFSLLIKFSSTLVVQNRYQQSVLMENHKRFENKVILIYNGFPVKKKAQKKGGNILWVARSDKWKRPELLMSLATLNPGRKFTMICPNSGDNEYYGTLVNAAAGISNLEYIKFVPFNEIDEYFVKASIFVNTSDHEGYPQTFIQSVMNGVPVLSLNVDPDGFITGRNCGGVFNGDINLLSRSINDLLNNSRLYKKISDNAYRYFLDNHDISKNVNMLVRFVL